MLIDSSHPEETRVVVLDGQKVEEFDFEAASKRPLKGNIYLAKVTRVEPSLQAAFVEYGGNRQGFLAFSEIHPDYYQIPVADRQALIAEQQAEARRNAEDEFEAVETGTQPMTEEELAAQDEAEMAERGDNGEEAHEDEPHDENGHGDHYDEDHEPTPTEVESGFDVEQSEDLAPQEYESHEDEHTVDETPLAVIAEEESEQGVVDQQTAAEVDLDLPEVSMQAVADALSGDITLIEEEFSQGVVDEQGAAEAAIVPEHAEQTGHEHDQPAQQLRSQRPQQRWTRRKHYKIQEVIKRRQIILVQVVKEERGNKGAALTTYISLAGRYCVLMPNTPRGGGISRKITNANDRKRLKSAAAALELPEGMGLIIRTAGENRTKVEIKRDYEYLLRMWDQIRETTLESHAPSCVYEEGDLIKRAIRDLYNKDVGEILVEGESGYRNAKDFMGMLLPSHTKNVKLYDESVPLFQRFHIEAQLDAMFTPTVTLKSGGYIVINQTEALVSIDVNSGRATREHSIEETAYKTNLEAADEIARQLRLRDLAGLIVIDFIDMEDGRNDRAVEKRLHNALRNDRARIQIGRISQFGLLEMSRQRLRAGVVAGSTVPCPHCGGQGIVRSVESTALRLLRSLEEEGQKQRASALTIKAPSDVAIYTLNQKRRELARIESDYGMIVMFEPSEEIHAGHFEIERTAQKAPEDRKVIAVSEMPAAPEAEEDLEILDEEATETSEEDTEETAEGASREESRGEEGGQRRGKRRRRRGGRGRSREDRPQTMHEPVSPASIEMAEIPVTDEEDVEDDGGASVEANGHPQGEQAQGEGGRRRRRRRRRGGRGRNRDNNNYIESEIAPPAGEGVAAETQSGEDIATPNTESAPMWSLGNEAPAAHETKPEPVAVERAKPAEPVAIEPVKAPEPERIAQTLPTEPAKPPRKGWWQRTFSSD
jgi:ribonuclease E